MSDGTWCYSRALERGDPAEGWKLHLSATVLSADDVFTKARPVLRKHRALFKIPASLEVLVGLNSGRTAFSQIGKFLTVYPRSTAEAVALARELHHATRGLAGPRVPFDVRYRKNGVVHYRYGSFRSVTEESPGLIRGPRGRRVRDTRGRRRPVPPWIEDPFAPRLTPTNRGPLGVNYLAYRAIAQRGKGGVYEALDLTTGPARRVLVKEGRRHGETGLDGKDGYARTCHEARVLRLLRKAGVAVPAVLHEFTQNGNRYIVLERLPGRELKPPRAARSSKISPPAAERIFRQVAAQLQLIHRAGWVWRDCKPSHLLVRRRRLHLIDFEGACRVEELNALPWGTPDYSPPPNHGRFTRKRGYSEDDYALGVVGFQIATGALPPLEQRRRTRILHASRCSASLQRSIEQLLAVV